LTGAASPSEILASSRINADGFAFGSNDIGRLPGHGMSGTSDG